MPDLSWAIHRRGQMDRLLPPSVAMPPDCRDKTLFDALHRGTHEAVRWIDAQLPGQTGVLLYTAAPLLKRELLISSFERVEQTGAQMRETSRELFAAMGEAGKHEAQNRAGQINEVDLRWLTAMRGRVRAERIARDTELASLASANLQAHAAAARAADPAVRRLAAQANDAAEHLDATLPPRVGFYLQLFDTETGLQQSASSGSSDWLRLFVLLSRLGMRLLGPTNPGPPVAPAVRGRA